MKIVLVVKLLCLAAMVCSTMVVSVGAVESDVEGGDLSDDELRDPTYRGRVSVVAKGSSPVEAAGRRHAATTVSGESAESETDTEEGAEEEDDALEAEGDDGGARVEVAKKKSVSTVTKRLGSRGPRGRRRSVAVGVKRGDDEEEVVVPKEKARALVVGDILEGGADDGLEEASGPTEGVPVVAAVPAKGGGEDDDDGEEDEEEDDVGGAAGLEAGEPSWTVDPPVGGRKRWFRMTIPAALRLNDASERSTAEEYSTWASCIKGGSHTVGDMHAPFYLRLLWWSKSTFTPLALSEAIEKIIEGRVEGALSRLRTRLEAREKNFFRSNKDVLSPGVIKHLWETSGERNSRLMWRREIDEDTRAYRQLLWMFIAWHFGITGPTDKFPKRRRDEDGDEDGDGAGGKGPAKRRAGRGGGKGGDSLVS